MFLTLSFGIKGEILRLEVRKIGIFIAPDVSELNSILYCWLTDKLWNKAISLTTNL
jgi:hypothetical protein